MVDDLLPPSAYSPAPSGDASPSGGAAPLLDIRGLEVDYVTRRGTVRAVRGVDLAVRQGETVAIVGESGSGKSTIAQAIIGLLAPEARVRGGSISLAGRELTSLSEPQWRAVRGSVVSLVPQDPTVSLNPVRRVGEQIADALVAHHIAPRTAARLRAVELLAEVGIDRPGIRARQYPHELSGGMRQRVLIAIAIACRPRLIIADEPTSALDATVQRQVLDRFAMLTAESGTAALFITHDLGVAAERADRIVVVNGGRIVEHGPSRHVLSEPSHQYTRDLLDAARALHGGVTRTPPGRDTERILTVDAVSKSFTVRSAGGGRERVDAVRGVDLSLDRGRTLALVGESGSGKTTVSRIVSMLTPPDSGTVRIDGIDAATARGAERRRLRRAVQVVHQNPYSSLDPLYTVRAIIEEPLRVLGLPRARRRERVEELVSAVRLAPDLLQRRPAALSGGQRQRVAIARALATRPELVVLDEPVSALDVSVQETIITLLAEIQREHGLSYLFVTHDLAVVRQIADDVAVMHRGLIVETGTTEALFASPAHPYTRQLLEAVPGRWIDAAHTQQ